MTKNKRGKLLGIAVACLLVSSLVVAGAIAPATILASPDPSVSIIPGTQAAVAGGTFSVDVLVDSDDIPITGCEVTVTFDPDLEASGLVGADLLGTAGLDALYIPSIGVGEAGYAGARFPAAGAIAVDGNFVTINFDVDAATTSGTYPLVVEATILDAGGEGLTVVLNDGEVVVTGVPPGDASVSIIPDTQPAVAGGTFSVGVEVDTAGIPVTACNVTVFFDADLAASGLVGADLLGVEGIGALYLPTIGVGEAGYAGVRIDGPVAVNGNFVTINFDVDLAAAGTYDLVVGATLLDAGGIPIAVIENDGEVVVGGGPGAASVSIAPFYQMVEAGGVFSVDVVVDSAGTPLTACEVAVFFDTDFTATGLVGADLLGGAGEALYIPTIDVGEVGYAGVRIGGPIAVNGDFVTIDFDVDLAATGTYDLWVEAILLDAGGFPIAVVENDGEVEIGLPIYDETFIGSLHRGARDYLCTIPAGATLLDITMTTAASPGPDMDVELYDGATKVIGEYGWIDSAPGGWYRGDYFGYSGYTPSPDPGSEYIDSFGPLERSYDLEVFAYQAGTYTVNVFYVMPGPDHDPPVIDIYAPDATVGVPATIAVSATDPSGVAWIWYGVWPDWYVLTGTEADYISCIIFAEAPGSEVSLEFIPTANIIGDYYVAAWACDAVGNCTPDLDPEIAYWEVT